MDQHSVTLYIKRDDLIHPEISGNKWRKLKFNILEAKEKGYDKILTLGGAYSNHLVATAAVTQAHGLFTTGLVRGDELTPESNQTLLRCADFGMRFEFISRQNYRELRSSIKDIVNNYPDFYIIPEGGKNQNGMRGVSELLDEIQVSFDQIITAVGTGTTLAGLQSGIKSTQQVMGFNVLKNPGIKSEIADLNPIIEKYQNWVINDDYHFGGYARFSDELIDFINQMKLETGILFDPIYTGKALFGVWDMIRDGIFDNQTLVFLHTGGLQGIAGFNQKSPRKIHI